MEVVKVNFYHVLGDDTAVSGLFGVLVVDVDGGVLTGDSRVVDDIGLADGSAIGEAVSSLAVHPQNQVSLNISSNSFITAPPYFPAL